MRDEVVRKHRQSSNKNYFFLKQAKSNAPPARAASSGGGALAPWHRMLRCEDPTCTATFVLWGRHHCRNCGSSVCDRHFQRPLCSVCVVATGARPHGKSV